jgi:hypothetical protein
MILPSANDGVATIRDCQHAQEIPSPAVFVAAGTNPDRGLTPVRRPRDLMAPAVELSEALTGRAPPPSFPVRGPHVATSLHRRVRHPFTR